MKHGGILIKVLKKCFNKQLITSHAVKHGVHGKGGTDRPERTWQSVR